MRPSVARMRNTSPTAVTWPSCETASQWNLTTSCSRSTSSRPEAESVGADPLLVASCHSKRLGQPEPTEHGPVKGDDFGNGLVDDAQDVDRERGVAVIARLADIIRHRRLAVGAREHAAERAERIRAEAAVDPGLHDLVAAFPDAGLRRHREAGVLAEQPLE